MQKYIKDWLVSRDKEEGDFVPCEFAKCNSEAVDWHHIAKQFMGMKRRHKKDWSDVIAICRKHHEYIHANNTDTMRRTLLLRVEFLLDILR